MQKSKPAESPDAYVQALAGWRRDTVRSLRSAARAVKSLDEQIKWGHLVYSANGPVLLIRAEASRVLFGFWRGKRLIGIDARLRPGGKYEMATIELTRGDIITPAAARRLVREAARLNESLGDPTQAARKTRLTR
jgi:hypothetical protein